LEILNFCKKTKIMKNSIFGICTKICFLGQFQMAAAAAQQNSVNSVLANVNTTSAPAATYTYPSATSAIANNNNVSAVANSMIGNNTLAQFNFLQRSFQRGFTENNRPAG
jgi:hypothetical protein